MTISITHLFDLPPRAVTALVGDSDREGWRFVRRRADELADGTNRFGRPGGGAGRLARLLAHFDAG